MLLNVILFERLTLPTDVTRAVIATNWWSNQRSISVPVFGMLRFQITPAILNSNTERDKDNYYNERRFTYRVFDASLMFLLPEWTQVMTVMHSTVHTFGVLPNTERHKLHHLKHRRRTLFSHCTSPHKLGIEQKTSRLEVRRYTKKLYCVVVLSAVTEAMEKINKILDRVLHCTLHGFATV